MGRHSREKDSRPRSRSRSRSRSRRPRSRARKSESSSERSRGRKSRSQESNYHSPAGQNRGFRNRSPPNRGDRDGHPPEPSPRHQESSRGSPVTWRERSPLSQRGHSRSRGSTPSQIQRPHRRRTISSNGEPSIQSEVMYRNVEDDKNKDRDSKRLDHITNILEELANNQDLSDKNRQALLDLGKQSCSKSYKERATLASSAVGLKTVQQETFKTLPAVCNPRKAAEEKRVKYPLVDSVKSRVTAAWRYMAGLKGDDMWDPSSDVPPPNPTKFNKGIPRPKLRENDYSLSGNTTLCAKGLTVESKFREKTDSTASVAMNRLTDWERTLTTSLSVLNMIDVFSASLDMETDGLMETIEECDQTRLPNRLKTFLADKERIKADKESRARALQHVTSLLAYMLSDNILLRRDSILAKCNIKMSENTKTVLRLQPLRGPYLFNGRVDELLKKDAESKTTDLVLKLSDNLLRKKFQNPVSSNKGRDIYRKEKFHAQSTSGYNKDKSHSFRGKGNRGKGSAGRSGLYPRYGKSNSYRGDKGGGEKKQF